MLMLMMLIMLMMMMLFELKNSHNTLFYSYILYDFFWFLLTLSLPSIICDEGDFVSFSAVLFVIIIDDPVLAAAVVVATKNRIIV